MGRLMLGSGSPAEVLTSRRRQRPEGGVAGAPPGLPCPWPGRCWRARCAPGEIGRTEGGCQFRWACFRAYDFH